MLSLNEMNNYFICDSCNNLIEDIDDGWFEWKTGTELGSYINKDFRIVHHNQGCMYKDTAQLSDGNLKDFIGDSGVMRLYEMLSETEGKENRDELIEIIKRVTVKKYEKVHTSLHKFYETGDADFSGNPMFPIQQEINEVIRLQRGL